MPHTPDVAVVHAASPPGVPGSALAVGAWPRAPRSAPWAPRYVGASALRPKHLDDRPDVDTVYVVEAQAMTRQQYHRVQRAVRGCVRPVRVVLCGDALALGHPDAAEEVTRALQDQPRDAARDIAPEVAACADWRGLWQPGDLVLTSGADAAELVVERMGGARALVRDGAPVVVRGGSTVAERVASVSNTGTVVTATGRVALTLQCRQASVVTPMTVLTQHGSTYGGPGRVFLLPDVPYETRLAVARRCARPGFVRVRVPRELRPV